MAKHDDPARAMRKSKAKGVMSVLSRVRSSRSGVKYVKRDRLRIG
jgi:hypothetical protein